MRLDSQPSKLVRHPASPPGPIWRANANFERRAGGVLLLRYEAFGRVADIVIPTSVARARANELWKHTCFEAFVRPGSGEAYFEFNFAPSLQWAAYAFDGYRTGMRAADFSAPQIACEQSDERLVLTAEIVLSAAASENWRLGLTAVIEATNGEKSYWALSHPKETPDFHDPKGFTFALIN